MLNKVFTGAKMTTESEKLIKRRFVQLLNF